MTLAQQDDDLRTALLAAKAELTGLTDALLAVAPHGYPDNHQTLVDAHAKLADAHAKLITVRAAAHFVIADLSKL